MSQSELITDLAASLAKAQGEIQNPTKNATNGHLNKKYADLAEVLSEILPVLSKYGLSLTQTTQARDGQIFLITTLTHSSGQWRDSELPLILSKQDMQGLGAAITYARRYSAAAMCGVAQADDDGNSIADVAAAKDLKPLPTETPKPPQSAECKHNWKLSQYKKDEEYCAFCKQKRSV